MIQVPMFHVATPPPPASIDLRCCDVVEMLADARDARLIVADPPWQYSEAPGVANPEVNGIYGGLPDSVSHQQTGYLANPYDVADLATGLTQALDDSQGMNVWSQAARLRAVLTWSPQVVVPQYLAVYEQACR